MMVKLGFWGGIGMGKRNLQPSGPWNVGTYLLLPLQRDSLYQTAAQIRDLRPIFWKPPRPFQRKSIPGGGG